MKPEVLFEVITSVDLESCRFLPCREKPEGTTLLYFRQVQSNAQHHYSANRTVFEVYGKKDIRIACNVFKKMYAGSGVSKNRERTACMLHAMHSSEILRCMHVRTCDCVRSSIVIRRYVLYISSVHLSELSE